MARSTPRPTRHRRRRDLTPGPVAGSVDRVLPRPHRRRPARRVPRAAVAAVAALAISSVVVACGGDDDTTAVDDTIVDDLELEPIDPDEGSGPDGTDDDGEPDPGGEGDAGADTDPTDPPASDKPDVDLPDEIPTELQITDLEVGTGRVAEVGDSVWVDYVGVVTSSGAEFDNSYDRGQPFDVRLGEGRVIRGWDEGLVGIQAGGRRQLDIPAELAYGDSPPPGSVIEAGDALTFVVDVRAVVAVEGEDAQPDLDLEPSVGRTDLGIDDVTVGDGAELEIGDTAILHLLLLRGDDLEILESTWAFEQPAAFGIVPDGAIPGLIDGMLGMRVGGLRVISIPPSLAFGPEGIPEAGLPADTDVIVVVELLGSY